MPRSSEGSTVRIWPVNSTCLLTWPDGFEYYDTVSESVNASLLDITLSIGNDIDIENINKNNIPIKIVICDFITLLQLNLCILFSKIRKDNIIYSKRQPVPTTNNLGGISILFTKTSAILVYKKVKS